MQITKKNNTYPLSLDECFLITFSPFKEQHSTHLISPKSIIGRELIDDGLQSNENCNQATLITFILPHPN